MEIRTAEQAELLIDPEKRFLLKRTILRNKLWRIIDYQPHPKQVEVHRAIAQGAKRIAMCWGRRTGKTTVCAAEIVPEMGFRPSGKIPIRLAQITGPKANITERIFSYLWKWVVEKRCFGIEPSAKSKRERYIEMPWGAKVEGKTTENTDNLLGEGVYIHTGDEHARNREDVLEQYIEPPLLDTGGIAILSTTPRGRNNHFAKTFREWGQYLMDGNKRYFTSHATSWDNPIIPREELIEYQHKCEIRGMLDLYLQEIMAEFTSLSGAIYPFRPTKDGMPWHVREFDPFPGIPLILGIDWGYGDPFVCLLVQYYEGTFYFIDEIYQKLILPNDQPRAVLDLANRYAPFIATPLVYNLCPECGFIELIDQTELETGKRHYRQCPICRCPGISEIVQNSPIIERAYCDPESPSSKRIFSDAGIPVWEPTGDEMINLNNVMEGITWVRSFYGRPDFPGIVIHPRCKNLIEETEAYIRKKDGSEKPIEHGNHTQDAKRYVIVGRMGCSIFEPFIFDV